MKKAAFPGSFDPISYGHLDIIRRASILVEKLFVVVAVNSEKKYLFSGEERMSMVRELIKPWKNVEAVFCDTLVVDFVKERDIPILIRGVRSVIDFAYEYELSMINRGLDTEVETVFMAADPAYFVLRSSSIKELASLGGDVSSMVPPLVAEALKIKYTK
ncbi:MAG: pantetheine-phosphate adenylyltransferase [Spirochaetaceae bacterium]|jgi:pantetheine-phosphate adenylyltransferase|nr:pantetheine-phosphate adenylyltransferase [Spirochaetaceae bacterium]